MPQCVRPGLPLEALLLRGAGSAFGPHTSVLYGAVIAVRPVESLAQFDLDTLAVIHAAITFLTTSIPYALMPSRKMSIASESKTSGGNTPVSTI
jgi:hypothetical protein